MRTILFVIYRLYGGGAERVVSNLSLALHERYNIKIAIYDVEERTYPHKGELIRIQLPYAKDPTQNGPVKRVVRLFYLIRKLRALKRQHKVDIAISFGEQANIINVLSHGRERLLLSMRTTLSKEMAISNKVRTLSTFIKKLYNRANTIVVPSKLAAIDLVKNFNVSERKLQVIYNYVDGELVNKLCNEPITESDLASLFQQKILLNVGRITPAKGQWLLFHLVKKVGVKLVIIGEGESEKHFKTQLLSKAASLGLKLYDRAQQHVFSLDYDVYLLGFDSNPFRFMKNSHMLVFSSTFEGFPNTVIEAMQSGLPVISADCQSGPREILAPGTDPSVHTTKTELCPYGILAPALPSADIEHAIDDAIITEWEQAINTLLNDESLRQQYIQRGKARAAEFEKNIVLKNWEELFNIS